MRYIALVFGLVFLLFAYFQFNDPDPELWVPVYTIAALGCFLALRRQGPPWLFYGLAAAYLIGAVLQWPPEFEGVLFAELGMRSVNIELARESLGLAICAVVMGVLGWLSGR
ncbi:hypothetical protein GCM10027275_09310 [Rhabdobacter roseus]|uniref:Transmembrane family 220 protein n=1 Tax=Rhabdobacter roseus TaxID=1655419 RepID=A0A840TMR2_9BACT|nr:transmembrane 220 family protein [Rhabdobacter roseus]MBB5282832.1 hypothetical protein [Rhabdobacter roseus]